MKNYQNLVKAVSRVRDRGLDARLTLVGSGHEREPYADEPFVTTPGFVNRAQLFRRIEESNLYVQPSNGDGFGVAALEAMLAGRPVLVSERTGVKELLADSWVTGTTPDAIATDLERVLRMDRDRLIAAGERNRSRAAELSPSRQAERFVRAIESMAEV
jgi:glycosyltransferase involved in cell wall biosynthesis